MAALNWGRANADSRMRRQGAESIDGSRSGRRPPSRPAASTPLAPKLAEPVIVSEFWANRRGESVRVQLREYEGALIVDVRRHYTAADGKLRPTSKGIALAIAKLPELASAVAKALTEARARGLVREASNG
jgi:Transcriptional Coactivator p15 (PC4)